MEGGADVKEARITRAEILADEDNIEMTNGI